MSEEEAIEYLKNFTKYTRDILKKEIKQNSASQYAIDLEKRVKIFETVLSILKGKDKTIQRQQKEIKNWEDHCTRTLEREITELNNENFEYRAELEKKDKIINLIIKEFYKKAHISTKCYLQESIKSCLKYKNCIECLKQYFERKVEVNNAK